MKYDNIEQIKKVVKEMNNYPDDTYTTSHVLGIALAYLTDAQVYKMLQDLLDEQQQKQISDELKYEIEAGK